MAPWRVRDFHFDDLDAAVRLWDTPAASSEAPAFGLSDLIAAVRSHEPAVVAAVGDELVGVTVATVTGDRAWVMRVSLAAAWRHRGIGSAMWPAPCAARARACGAGQRDKWVDRIPMIMRTWSWLTRTSDWSRAMRGLESVRRKTPARYPLFEPGVVNRLGRANSSVAQNGPAISAS